MIRVLIIGAGNMGALYDINNMNPNEPRSHLSGFQNNSDFQVVGIVDPDSSKLKLIREKNVALPIYTNIDDVPASSFDVITIASSTKVRLEIIEKFVASSKLIFCEKPLASTLSEGLQIKAVVAHTPFFLNYSRRWNLDIKTTFDRIKSGEFGSIQSINSIYTKGFINNGSHQMDLLHFLGCEARRVRRTGSLIQDGFFEPTFSFDLEMKDSSENVFISHHTALNYNSFTIFEMDILLTKGRVKISNSGDTVLIERPESDSLYVDYKFLHKSELFTQSQSGILRNAVQQVADFFHKAAQPNCTLSDGLKVLATCSALQKTITEPNLWIDVEYKYE